MEDINSESNLNLGGGFIFFVIFSPFGEDFGEDFPFD